MSTDLSLLCVTEGRDYGKPFLDEMAFVAKDIGAEFVLVKDGTDVHSGGYLESVLDDALARCETDYILRLDDDERVPLETIEWLRAGSYREAEHWAFKRRNLWPDHEHFITNPPLWPDLQTRLSVKRLAGGRPAIHAASPFGTGAVAPVPIDHHKFLVRTREEREALVQRYENVTPGAGSQYVMFSVPERYEGMLKCDPL